MKAILFDWDGTIVDSIRALYETDEAVCRRIGVPFNEAIFRRTFSPNWRRMYDALGITKDRFDDAERVWSETFRADLMLPFDGVVGALAVVGLGMAAFSAPNTSAIMGSVDRAQLSVASAFLATMRVTGQALSVAFLGGIAASRLGSGGWRLLLRQASGDAADAFAWGYRAAMLTGAALALLGAWASLTRSRAPARP